MVARQVACNTHDVAGPVLLERERELAELAQAAREAAAGEGGLVLVFGEAGIGKSSLVRGAPRAAAGRGQPAGRPLRRPGHPADPWAVPRPGRQRRHRADPGAGGGRRAGPRCWPRCGPSWTGPGTRPSWWSRTCTGPTRPPWTCCGYLVRRIADLPAVLVLTYRDDELTREHPLQQLLGQASAAGRVRRLPLRRLSEDAVRWLSAASRVDAARRVRPDLRQPVLRARGARRRGRRARPAHGRRCGAGPGAHAWTRPPRMRSSSSPWFRPRWSGGWSTRWWRAGWPRWRRPRSAACSPCHRPRWRSGTSSTRRAVADSVPVARRVALNRRVLAGAGRAGGRRPVAHRAPRGRGRRRGRDRPLRAGGGPGRGRRRRPPGGGRPLPASPASPRAVRPGGACRAAGGVRRRVLHGRCLDGPDRRVGGGRAAPVAGRPARARGGPALAVPDAVVGRRPRRRRAQRRGGDRRAGGGWRPPAARPGPQQPGPAPHAGLPRQPTASRSASGPSPWPASWAMPRSCPTP